LFPEVDCFNSKLQFDHSSHCKQNGSPIMRHVLYPRYNAFIDICQHVRRWHIYLYDLTIVYWLSTSNEKQFKVPNLIDLLWYTCDNEKWHAEVFVKRYPMVSMSSKKRKLETWLEKTWVRKDNRIHEHLFPLVKATRRNRVRFFTHKR
jgi:hypothetical protein